MYVNTSGWLTITKLKRVISSSRSHERHTVHSTFGLWSVREMGDHDSYIKWQQCHRWNKPYQIAKLSFYFIGCCRCFCCCWSLNIIFDMSNNRTCRKNVVIEQLRLNNFFQSWGVINLHRLILSMYEVSIYTAFPEFQHILTEYQFITSNGQLLNYKTFLVFPNSFPQLNASKIYTALIQQRNEKYVDICLTVHHWYKWYKHQLDITITVY